MRRTKDLLEQKGREKSKVTVILQLQRSYQEVTVGTLLINWNMLNHYSRSLPRNFWCIIIMIGHSGPCGNREA